MILKNFSSKVSTILILSALLLSEVLAPIAKAAEEDTSTPGLFKPGNGVTWYDKGCTEDTPECCPASEESDGSTSTDIKTNPGDSNGKELFAFFVAKGLTDVQAAGFLGNVMAESGGNTFDIDPKAVNPSSGAYGIVQWMGGRVTALEALAAEQGKDKSNLYVQFDHLWNELQGPYKDAVLNPIKASNDLGEVTRIVLERFEIPCNPGAACDPYFNDRLPNSERALEEFAGVSASDVGGSSEGCAGSESGSVNSEGFAFPLGLAKDKIDYLPCDARVEYQDQDIITCHHDGSPAMDAFAPVGTPVFAIEDGSILYTKDFYDGIAGCYSIALGGKSGWKYWYGHLQNPVVNSGKKVKAGEKLAVVGETQCAKNTAPHLHIDRGAPKGNFGGVDAERDPSLIPLLNKLFEELQ